MASRKRYLLTGTDRSPTQGSNKAAKKPPGMADIRLELMRVRMIPRIWLLVGTSTVPLVGRAMVQLTGALRSHPIARLDEKSVPTVLQGLAMGTKATLHLSTAKAENLQPQAMARRGRLVMEMRRGVQDTIRAMQVSNAARATGRKSTPKEGQAMRSKSRAHVILQAMALRATRHRTALVIKQGRAMGSKNRVRVTLRTTLIQGTGHRNPGMAIKAS
jgi:hypothetical protein